MATAVYNGEYSVRKNTLLVVDDDPLICELYSQVFEANFFQVCSAPSIDECRKLLTANHFDVILLDVCVGEENGLQWIEKLLVESGGSQIMMLTADGKITTAVEAMRKGATGFFTKDMGIEQIVSEVQALCNFPVQQSVLPKEKNRFGLVGNSDAITKVIEEIIKIKDVPSTVLITGESGCGKELVARALHEQSNRSCHPFSAINCAAIPENLLESELFGHKRGAFTDAREDRKGLFESCSNGTLFLDEIGDMPPLLQVKLLRVLQDKEVRPVGSTRSVKVNTRVVTATHRNLEEEVEAKRFRHDLFYRLSVLKVDLAPLRQRREDIPLLVEHFRKNFTERFNRMVLPPKPWVMQKLIDYSWPGNVRELQNIVEQVVVMSENGEFNLPKEFLLRSTDIDVALGAVDVFREMDYSVAKERFEKEYIVNLLREAKGNVSEASRISGQHRPQLYRWISRYGLDIGKFKNDEDVLQPGDLDQQVE